MRTAPKFRTIIFVAIVIYLAVLLVGFAATGVGHLLLGPLVLPLVVDLLGLP